MEDCLAESYIPTKQGIWTNLCRMAEFGQPARTVRDFRQKFALEDDIGSHACWLEANTRTTNDIPLGSPPLTVATLNYELCPNTEGQGH
jgi:hypothetical protein